MTILCCNYSHMILTAEQQPNDEHNIAKEDIKKKQFAPTLCNISSSLQCCQTPPNLACDYHINLSITLPSIMTRPSLTDISLFKVE